MSATLTWEQAVQWLRTQPGEQALVRQCYYDDPLDEAAQRFHNSEEWRATRHLLAHHLPGRVLDVGAGRGSGAEDDGWCGARIRRRGRRAPGGGQRPVRADGQAAVWTS